MKSPRPFSAPHSDLDTTGIARRCKLLVIDGFERIPTSLTNCHVPHATPPSVPVHRHTAERRCHGDTIAHPIRMVHDLKLGFHQSSEPKNQRSCIDEAIKLLSADDSPEPFTKTLPSPVQSQLQNNKRRIERRARAPAGKFSRIATRQLHTRSHSVTRAPMPRKSTSMIEEVVRLRQQELGHVDNQNDLLSEQRWTGHTENKTQRSRASPWRRTSRATRVQSLISPSS